MKVFCKVKKEYDDFKMIRKDLGLKSSNLIDLEKIRSLPIWARH